MSVPRTIANSTALKLMPRPRIAIDARANAGFRFRKRADTRTSCENDCMAIAEGKPGAEPSGAAGAVSSQSGPAVRDRLRTARSRNRDDRGDDIMAVSPMRVTAVIAAGGSGARLGGPRPKQLLDVGGQPILARSLRAFLTHASIDEIVVA